MRKAEEFVSRRALLFGGLSSLAAMSPSRTQAAPRPDAGRFLIDRLTFGWTQQEQLLADTLGYHGYLEYQLNPSSIDDSATDARIAPYYFLNYDPASLKGFQSPVYIMHQCIESTVVRSVYSKRQLFEKMVEFWNDHFSVESGKSHIPWLFPVWLRDTIRANAMTTFPQLLAATAQSAVMMFYLDNETSIGGNPNENYARELMELHSLGVDAGYSQGDIEELARILTGWGVDHYGNPETITWNFIFHPNWHDDTAKTFLGVNFPAGGGMNDGVMALDILATHPATAHFISKKLCRKFWSYDPPQSLVDAVAATYMATGGDIKSMLRTLFTTLDPASATPKHKRPYHFAVSAMRSTGAELSPVAWSSGTELEARLLSAGHLPFNHGPPDGYPDRLEAWAGLMLPRWNMAAELMNNGITHLNVNIATFLQGATTGTAVADRIDQALFGNLMPSNEKSVILGYLGANPNSTTSAEAVALALSAPSYQWY
ncbi:MAG: hypothetical protein AMXMBFR20_06140 [Planctomycetia bacterium]